MAEKWSDYLEYIEADMLGGKAWVLTIQGVQDEKMFDREAQAEEQKPVLYFKGTDKGLVLTRTNRRKIKELFGDVIADCIGKKVRIEAVQVKAFGKMQDVVRIFEPAEEKAASAAPEAGATTAKPEIFSAKPDGSGAQRYWSYVETLAIERAKAERVLAAYDGDFLAALSDLEHRNGTQPPAE